jgi:hypothetical protein
VQRLAVQVFQPPVLMEQQGSVLLEKLERPARRVWRQPRPPERARLVPAERLPWSGRPAA